MHVTVGTSVTFTVHPRCASNLTVVEHDAAYTAPTSPPPEPSGYEHGCPVSQGEVTCTFDEPGTYLLTARASTGDGDERQLHASSPYKVIALEDAPEARPGGSTVTLMDLPAKPAAGEPVTFRILVEWAITPPGVDTDRIGARYDTEHHANASLEAYDAGCPYVAGIVPGDGDGFHVTCTFATPGTVYLRGFAQTPSGPDWVEHWGQEVPVVVR